MKNLKHVLTLLLFSYCAFAASALAEITYYINDLSGSPVVAMDEAGQVIWRESYRPYGERLKNETGSQENKTWFTSRHQDVDTGLVYMGARYYDPMIGRFLSTDPQRFTEKNIHSFNRYAYGNNNPYRYRDPDGRDPISNAANPRAELEERNAGRGNFGPDFLDYAFQFDWVVPMGGAAKLGMKVLGKADEAAVVARGATQIAQEGGRHAGQLQQFLKQTPEQLQKTINSFDKQIGKHEGWIADPASKVQNFSQLRQEHQQNLIHHWQQDVLRHQELKSIAQDVLKGL